MKINGTPHLTANKGTPLEFIIYKVKLHGGPADGIETLAGNTTEVFCAGHRYTLNADGDFVYEPEASTGAN